MIQVLVISDTHHNFHLMESVLKQETNIDYLIHLGDEHDDLDHFPEYLEKINVISVPGIYHNDYFTYPNRRCLKFQIGSVLFQIAHAPKDLKPFDAKTHIYMHGHTHEPIISHLNNSLLINPGHLKAPRDRGFDASYALLMIENSSFTIALKNMNYQIFKQSEQKL